MDLITREMKTARPGVYEALTCQVAYAGSKQKCDLVISGSIPLRIEIKMARFFGDNGKPTTRGSRTSFLRSRQTEARSRTLPSSPGTRRLGAQPS